MNWENDEYYRQQTEDLTRYGDPDWLKIWRATLHSVLHWHRRRRHS